MYNNNLFQELKFNEMYIYEYNFYIKQQQLSLIIYELKILQSNNSYILIYFAVWIKIIQIFSYQFFANHPPLKIQLILLFFSLIHSEFQKDYYSKH
ncbi:hypothetical protein ABPG73_022942 [Tetrahymena malaccensis]